MIYETGSKLEKHQAFVQYIKDKIALLEQQREQIEAELVELRQKLAENEDYIPEEQ